MKIYITVPIMIAGLLTAGCISPSGRPLLAPKPETVAAEQASLLLLTNYVAVVGILPQAAGRTVVCRTVNGRNALKSDRAQWGRAAARTPAPASDEQVQDFGGHVATMGPRSSWWTQQDVNPERRRARATWPPDPFMHDATYRVVQQTPGYLKLEGPGSPVSGLKFTKEIALLPDGRIRHRVAARNITDRDLKWSLGTRTRLPADATFYIPIDDDKSEVRARYVSKRPLSERPYQATVVDGFFTFRLNDGTPTNITRRLSAKITPFDAVVASFNRDRVLVKRIPKLRRQRIHPDEAIFEIMQGPEGLSLIAHGPYVRLKPGDSMNFTEQWAVYPYPGPADPKKQIAFLRALRVAEEPPPPRGE